MLAMGQYIESPIIQTLQSPTSIHLRAGKANFHLFDCNHASGPNNSLQTRLGLATKKPNREMATWICGTMDNYFDAEPRYPLHPTEEDVGRERNIQGKSMKREASDYFAKQDI